MSWIRLSETKKSRFYLFKLKYSVFTRIFVIILKLHSRMKNAQNIWISTFKNPRLNRFFCSHFSNLLLKIELFGIMRDFFLWQNLHIEVSFWVHESECENSLCEMKIKPSKLSGAIFCTSVTIQNSLWCTKSSSRTHSKCLYFLCLPNSTWNLTKIFIMKQRKCKTQNETHLYNYNDDDNPCAQDMLTKKNA